MSILWRFVATSRVFWIFWLYLMILYVLCCDFVIENWQNPTFYDRESLSAFQLPKPRLELTFAFLESSAELINASCLPDNIVNQINIFRFFYL